MRSSLVSALLPALLICVIAGAQEAPTPIAHWRMDAVVDGGVADVTGNGHDATVGPEGVELKTAPSPCGSGLLFGGNDQGAYLQVGNSDDLRAPAQITAMAWIKPANRGIACEIVGNKGDKSGDPPWPGWRLRYNWQMLSFEIGGPGEFQHRLTSAGYSLPVGHWAHVAATYDGQTMRLYINCTVAAEADVPGSILPKERWPIFIGNYSGRKNAYAMDGALDEVKVFDRALSEEEVFAAAIAEMAE